MRAYRLIFRAPLHVDSRGTGFYQAAEPFVRSDTLSAALLSAWALLDPESAGERAADPPFRVSSAFPVFRAIPFLPRPLPSSAIALPELELDRAKAVKRIQWLSPPLFREVTREPHRLLTGVPLKQARTHAVENGEVARALGEDPPQQRESRTRLTVDRATDGPVAGQLFQFARVHFHPEGGLHFLAEVAESARAAFEAALSVLGDNGLGADRSSGHGLFQWQAMEPPALPTAEDGPTVALSLVNPAPKEQDAITDPAAAYALISRGGWIGSTGLRRRRVRMLTEGSVLPRPIRGRVLDVTPGEELTGPAPPHRVYRDGRGLFAAAGGAA